MRITGPELDDLACQATADALMAITGMLGQFRGESRFTIWACKFAIFEVSAEIGRHFWHHPAVLLDAEDWDRLPDRFWFGPAQEAEWRDLAAALRRAADDTLTPRQRQVFAAIVLNGIPLDALVRPARPQLPVPPALTTVPRARRRARSGPPSCGAGKHPPQRLRTSPPGHATVGCAAEGSA